MRAADLTAALGQTIDPTRLMQRVTDRTLELIDAADGVMVGLADSTGVTYVCAAGHQVAHLGTRVGLDSSLTGLAVRTGHLQRSHDTESDPRVDAQACQRMSIVSLVCLPLSRQHETLGVLAVNAARPNAFTDHDIATLTKLADFISVVIGSACDLSRVKAQLLELCEPSDDPTGLTPDDRRAADAASRYVMSVLSPDMVGQIEAGQRVQGVLDFPQALSIVFQPIIDLATNEVAAVEALARFDVTPYRPPNVWFTEAHQNGLGVELELLAITRALSQLPMLPDGIALTVNAGPQTVMCPQLRDAVLAAPTGRVVLELTEHTVIDDYPGLIASVQAMRRSGTRIAIDDTGSGYTSLAHLLKLAPDLIKLDRDLVADIDVDPVRRALAASLVAFAADTGAEIVAEGIESEDELETLRRIGVHYAQGYYLAHPGPIDALPSWQWQRVTTH
jgi:EAL domain-containing protein (putative c-di-GMP-specific phosphodiesterase class I)